MAREFWNARFGAQADAYGAAPNRFLASCAGLLPENGRALVPGDGQGRNGVWLAEQGLSPLCVDLSDVGLAQARRRAADRGVVIEPLHGDFLEIDLPEDDFAACVSIFLHMPPARMAVAHRRMAAALAPGGVLIIEGFAEGQEVLRARHGSGGPPDPDWLFTAEQLRAELAPLRALFLEETTLVLDEGPFHSGMARVVRGVFAKG
jgi:SAM-dependent methyltransferase